MIERFTKIKKHILEEKYKHLNPVQREAAFQTKGPILILAGAGSGKTTAIANRISYMLKYGESYHEEYLPGTLTEDTLSALEACDPNNMDFFLEQLLVRNPVDPYSILAITFTNKAATEMRERVEKIAGIRGRNMWMLTFHAACVRILRQDIELIGFNSTFSIFDSADSKTLIKDCMKELNIDEKTISHRVFQNYISSFKDKYVSFNEIGKYTEGNPILEATVPIYRLYQEKLEKYNALDFDDIIFHTVTLFKKHKHIREKWQDRFKYVLVDEYQDTSKIQYMLISMLCETNKNICVVGDDDQSIYKFRGADIQNILSFEKQFANAKILKLEQNYRSTATILDSANAVIANNSARKSKKLWTNNQKGEKITLLTPYNEKDEAQLVGETITDLLDMGYTYNDIAILYRVNAQSRAIEENFLRNGIPHRIVGGTRFFDRKEIKDIVSYMRLAFHTADDVSLLRIINEPKRGLGQGALSKITELAAQKSCSIFEILEEIETYDTLIRYHKEIKRFVKMIYDFQEKIQDVEDFCKSVIYGSGYMDMLNADNSIESRTRAENVKELLSMVKDFKSGDEEPTAQNFLENIALMSDIDNYDISEEAVVLMSMHSAKGLEFKIVFVLGLEDGLFPSAKSAYTQEELEEERRLMYVAVTRAKERLYFTTTSRRMLFGMTTTSRPSRFIAEIPRGLICSGYVEEAYVPKKTISAPPAFKSQQYIKEVSAVRTFDFKENDRVLHKKFGAGTILSAEKLGGDMKLKICFDDAGDKTLMATFAKLEKL